MIKRLPLLLALALLFSSCKVQKHITKTTENRDSIARVELATKLAEVMIEKEHYKKRVEELEYLAITFVECPPAVNADSLLKYGCDTSYVASLRNNLDATQSEVERLADGSLKIKGRLSSVIMSKQKIEDSLHDATKEINRLKYELSVAQSQVKTEIKTVEKEVKRTSVWPFALNLLIAFVCFAAGWYAHKKREEMSEARADLAGITIRKPQK